MAKKLNERCPLQGECEKVCKFTYRERECAYYQGNSRPGLEIPDQSEASSSDSDDQLLAALGNADLESAGEAQSALRGVAPRGATERGQRRARGNPPTPGKWSISPSSVCRLTRTIPAKTLVTSRSWPTASRRTACSKTSP